MPNQTPYTEIAEGQWAFFVCRLQISVVVRGVHWPSASLGDRTTTDFCFGGASMKEIPLTNGQIALVDDGDYERVRRITWCASPAKYTTYARSTGTRETGGKSVKLHRFILNAPTGMDVDHRDQNGLNCQRRNLRVCSRAQNSMNRRTQNHSSDYKGVTLLRRWSKWRATIKVDGKKIHIGYFSNPKAAAQAYDAKARELFGEFARTNF
jgi:hypothetical protein